MTTNEKFLFDQNIFDDNGNIEMSNALPEAPVFSEDELNTAKKIAYQKGYAQAQTEARESHEKDVRAALDNVNEQLHTYMTSEQYREKLYEREVISLCTHIFETLYPHYAEKTGLENLNHAISTIVQKHSQKQELHIRIHPDVEADIRQLMDTLKTQDSDLRYTITKDQTLAPAACKIKWNNGGALHDNDTMAKEILNILKDALAGKPLSVHDNSDEEVGVEIAPLPDVEDPPPPSNGDTT